MIILCRNCKQWYSTAEWKGNCQLHPWEQDKWSETTEPNYECQGKDYVDKYEKLRVEVK